MLLLSNCIDREIGIVISVISAVHLLDFVCWHYDFLPPGKRLPTASSPVAETTLNDDTCFAMINFLEMNCSKPRGAVPCR